jgi:hypothetical protein
MACSLSLAHPEAEAMSYRCPARHTQKTDVYWFGDGKHKLFYERCCIERVGEPGALCAKHAQRHDGEYKTKDPRLLCQWNYVFHHGLIGEAYGPHTQMYGSPYYEAGLKKGWGVPKKHDLEKAVAMQKAIQDLALAMQMKITDYMKNPDTTATAEPTELKKEKAKGSAKRSAKPGRKKCVQADGSSTLSSKSSSSSALSSLTSVSSVSASGRGSTVGLPMYIPKGPVPYAEAEDDPIVITLDKISTLILYECADKGTGAGTGSDIDADTQEETWIDDEGQHYRKSANGIIQPHFG